jgi:hypothetical protein
MAPVANTATDAAIRANLFMAISFWLWLASERVMFQHVPS